jgi:hypothetical protein
MKSEKIRLFTMPRKTRKGAKILRKPSSILFRTDADRRLRWLLGFALESSERRSPAERRAVCNQLGVYLDGLCIRRAGKDRQSVMRGDPLTSAAFTRGRGAQQQSFEDTVELIRADVRRIVTQFLGSPTISLRVTGEIAWQCILERDSGGPPTFRERWMAADVRKGIMFRLLEDLAEAGALVRECPATGCGRVFVRRYRQEFCSTACRNRANFRIWYQRMRKKRKGTVMLPNATRRKRRSMYLRRARAIGKPKPRAKSA